MNLRLAERPTWEPVSLVEAKEWLRVDIDDDDDLIASLITAAREYAETFTARCIAQATWELSLDRFPCGGMILPMPPVQSATISYTDTAGISQSFAHFVLKDGEPARLLPEYGYSWPSTRDVEQAVTVSFVAGWPDAESVPATIKTAMRMMLAGWYENREHIVPGSLSKVPFAAESLLLSNRWGCYA